MKIKYSVLMSVYEKERPEYLRAAIKSIINQTLPPDEIVLVCDGKLNSILDQVIEEFFSKLRVIKLQKNQGLGIALSEGLKYCKNEWIARMDSDDIAVQDRCEKQISFVSKYPETDILSGALAEFEGEAISAEEAGKKISAYKVLPIHHNDIEHYLKYRNPINHPCVMFRKSKVQEAGGYQPCLFFEDYDLWIRMYQKNCIFSNLPDVILFMRVNNMHRRRGGIKYARAIFDFQFKMYQRHILRFHEFIYLVLLRVGISLLPNCFRRRIYTLKLRKHQY